LPKTGRVPDSISPESSGSLESVLPVSFTGAAA
jgi:hypothetical protein